MKIELINISIQEISNEYEDKLEEGVSGYSGKLDYTMSAIVGFAGLQPTIDAIKISKIVAIANKETIICAWDILKKILTAL